MLFKQIVRSAAPARRQLSTSAPRLAGFGTAGKDEKAIPASKSTLSDQVSHLDLPHDLADWDIAICYRL